MIALLLLSIIPNSAYACTTVCGVGSPLQPAEQLPTNIGLWVGGMNYRTEHFRFQAAGVPSILANVQTTDFINASIQTVDLKGELEPNTEYQLYIGEDYWTNDGQSGYVMVDSGFNIYTTDGPFNGPPESVDIMDIQRSRGTGRGSTCDAWTALDVTFTNFAEEGGYLELQASEEADFNRNDAYVVGENSIHFGTCGHNLAPSTQYWWRVRSLDAAGNASAWSAPTQYRTAAECGCSSSPTLPLMLFSTPLLALFGRRRTTARV